MDGAISRVVSRASVGIGLVVFALGAGVYFTIATRFLQIRYFKEMIKLLFEGKSSETGISSFQAFCLALSGRVGIGNIAGVATAIAFGGRSCILDVGNGSFRSS